MRQVAAGEALLTCSFVRPLRTSLGEQVESIGWIPGPPPFTERPAPIARLESSRENPCLGDLGAGARVRSAEKRMRYFQNRMRSLLYPDDDATQDGVSGARRYSPELIEMTPWQPTWGLRGKIPNEPVLVVAREHLVLNVPGICDPAEYVMIHMVAAVPARSDPFALLANLRGTVSNPDRMLELGIHIVYTPGEDPPVRSSVHLQWPDGRDPLALLTEHAKQDGTLDVLRTCLQSWTPEELAMILLAGRQILSEKSPDPMDRRVERGIVHLSYDWRAFVGRNGFTFLALTPDSATFHPAARSLCQSMYFDALVLGQVQLDAANRIADSVMTIELTEADPKKAALAERRLLDFRGKIWWSHVTEQAETVNALLARFQEQHRLPSLVAQFNQDLTDLARYQTLQQESRVNRVIALLTALFLVPTLVLAAGSIYVTANSWTPVLASTAISVIGALATLAMWRWVMRPRASRRLLR